MSEIKMNKKKTALEEFKNIIANGNSNQDIEQFIQIMELPDKEFDKIYPLMKDKLMEVYTNPAYEAEVLTNLQMEMKRNPDFNMEEQANAARDFIKTLKDEDMGDNKKEFLQIVLENAVLKFIEIYDNPREKIRVKIQKIDEDAVIPTYAHSSDAGADISSVEEITLAAGETKIVKTGLKVAIPKGYEIQLRPRSGLSSKTPLRIANSPATIDSGYRGEIGVIIWNSGTEPYTIKKGDKIAQMLIAPTPMIVWEETEVKEDTDRGTGGFGSTDA